VRLDGRLPEPIEVGAYYVVCETLANVAKHARASVVEVDAEISTDTLHLRVRDDGIGGALPAGGSGLTGLRDRVEALGGTFALESPAGRGTTIWCELPTTLGPRIPGLAFHSVNEATPPNPDSRPGNF
jgi:signal transduction histidine kinase